MDRIEQLPLRDAADHDPLLARAGDAPVGAVVVLVGFGGHRGGVVAGRERGAQTECGTVPPIREGSLEHLVHGRPGRRLDSRAIGVVHRPERERWGDDVPTGFSERDDASPYLEDTTPLQPLHLERPGDHVPPAAEAV